MEASRAAELVAMITAAFPAWKPTLETVKLYAKLLEPVPLEIGQQAIMELLSEPREFAPAVGVIIDRAAKLALAQSGSGLLSAEEAWALVMDRIGSNGSYRGPGSVDQVTRRAIEAIGWHDLCTNPNIEASRAHFLRIHVSLANDQVATARNRIAAGVAPVEIEEQKTRRLPDQVSRLVMKVTDNLAKEPVE